MKKCADVKQSKFSFVSSDTQEPLAPALVPAGRATPTDTQGLSEIVANPLAPESKWMAACVLAGEKSLVPAPSFSSRFWDTLSGGAGFLFCVLTLMFAYVVSLFLGAHLAWLFAGNDLNTFMHANGDAMGLCVGYFGALTFWTGLLARHKISRTIVLGLSIISLIIVSIGTYTSFVSGSLMAGLSILMTVGLGYLGYTLREALPKSFSPVKLAGSLVGVLTLPAMIMVWMLWTASTSSPDPSPYAPADMPGLVGHLAILSFCVFLPGIAIARACRSKSLSACTTLATSVQMPLLAGIIISVLMSGFEAAALTRCLSLVATFLIAAAMASAGGAIGATLNRRF